MSEVLQKFHGLSYLPVSDGALNKRTRATSTNIYGGWAEFSFRMDEYTSNKPLNTFSTITRVNGSNFISRDGTISAGTYYFEFSFITAGQSGEIEIPLSFDSIIAGFPESTYKVNPYASSTLCLIVRFDSSTRLRTNSVLISKMKTLFIASYDSTTETLKNFNSMSYIPADESEDIMRYSAGIHYGTRPTSTAYPSILAMNNLSWDSVSGEELPSMASETYPWHHGYWRTYACGQVDTGTTILKKSNTVSRGGDSLIQTGYFPDISTFGQEVYSSFYSSRISDFTPYLSHNPAVYEMGDLFVPSFRKNTSKIVHTVATVDLWDRGHPYNVYVVSNPFRSRTIILPEPELENWTWFSQPKAMLVSWFSNNYNDQRDHTLNYSDGNQQKSVKIGYNHQTVLIHVGGDIGFEVVSEDLEDLGRFYMSVTFLP
ncbi:hypothetical protein VPHK406_0027 [Vibrio phage K406]